MKPYRMFVALGLSLLAVRATALPITFNADLTHDQETVATPLLTSTGGTRALSYGTATFELNDAQTELKFTATIYNIDVTGTQTADTLDNLTAAHIHNPGAPGTNGPVRWGFFGSPDNDNNPDNLVVTPFATGVGGTFSSIWNLPEGNAGTTLTSNLPTILADLSYINFHTVQFAGGEIRGQIIHVPDVASTAALLGLALAGLVGLRRRLGA